MDPLAAVLAFAVLLVAAWERRQLLNAFQGERDQWAQERQVLLERIQRPSTPPHLHVPRRHTEQDREQTERQQHMQEQMARVGTAAPLRDLSERPDEAA